MSFCNLFMEWPSYIIMTASAITVHHFSLSDVHILHILQIHDEKATMTEINHLLIVKIPAFIHKIIVN